MSLILGITTTRGTFGGTIDGIIQQFQACKFLAFLGLKRPSTTHDYYAYTNCLFKKVSKMVHHRNAMNVGKS